MIMSDLREYIFSGWLYNVIKTQENNTIVQYSRHQYSKS